MNLIAFPNRFVTICRILVGSPTTNAGTNAGTVPPVINAAPVASPQPKPGATGPAANKASGQPDLIVSAIKVNGQAPDGKDDCKDGKNAVAVIVKNAGAANAGPFAVRLDADGDTTVDESVDGLEAGKEREVRFGDVRLKKGEHQLAATLDAKNTVAESGEDNNAKTVTAGCRDS